MLEIVLFDGVIICKFSKVINFCSEFFICYEWGVNWCELEVVLYWAIVLMMELVGGIVVC